MAKMFPYRKQSNPIIGVKLEKSVTVDLHDRGNPSFTKKHTFKKGEVVAAELIKGQLGRGRITVADSDGNEFDLNNNDFKTHREVVLKGKAEPQNLEKELKNL